VSGAEVTRRLRERSAAVAVGVATVIADDPLLTVRSAENTPAPEQPLRLILVRETPPPATAALFADATAETAIVATDTANLGSAESLASGVVRYDATSGATGMFRAIAGLGVDSVLVEAGPRLLTSLWTERVLDRLVTVTAGGMGGLTAPPTYLGAADAVGEEVVSVLSPVETGIVGEVSVTVWRPDGSDLTI
jgi:riboflavin biosynthesis pyrimidine reductase